MSIFYHYILHFCFIVAGLSAHIRTSYNMRSNELSQFKEYLSITGHKNDSFYLNSNCSSFNHADIKMCNLKLNEIASREKKIPSPCPRRTHLRDCNYYIKDKQIYHHERFGIFVSFEIFQWNCSSNCSARGGSSFDIISKNEMFALSCGVIDGFNNRYFVSCYLPSTFKEIHYISSCLNISIILEYEHYDAFGMESEYHKIINQELFLNETFCMKENDKPSDFRYKLPFSELNYQKNNNNNNMNNKSDSRHYLRGIWIANHTEEDYDFYGEQGRLMSNESFQKCFHKQVNVLLGESHQR